MATPGRTASPPLHLADWPAPSWPAAPSPGDEARVQRLLASLSIEEKVGQIIQADINSVTPDDARRYHLGAILNGGDSGPGKDDFAPPAKWLALADAFYAASTDRSGGAAGVPILWGTDAVHGHSNIIGATLFPHNVGLGAAHDPDLIRRIGAATAIEVRATGMEWTFAPTVAVPQDWRWGRAYEGYGSDPALVAAYADAMVRGLQGDPDGKPILAGPHVLATVKHFIGDGATANGQDQGDAQIDEATLRQRHAPPYAAAINAGVGAIMASFSSWQGDKLTGSRALLTDLLKGRMTFGGMVVSDWNAHGQVAGCTATSCAKAVNAGLDLVMAPDSWRGLYDSLLAQVKSGEVPMARLDDAVARVLRVKARLGLFDAGPPSARPLSGRFDLLGAPEHRALAREAVRKSLVLLKNQGGLLPLRPGARLLVAGDAAEDIARAAGGWTLTWQGTGLDNSRFPGATSIWAGLRDAATAAGGSAELSPDGRFRTRPDAAIVVFGEKPYAEFAGDLGSLRLKPDNRGALAVMQRLQRAGVPVVAVLLTGRPLFMNPELNSADAFVVAWLPGSEGAGVADLLLQPRDRPTHDFTGRLPMDWPITADAHGAPLFARGAGLSLHDSGDLRRLPEDPGVPEEVRTDLFLDRGHALAPWTLRIGDGGGATTAVTALPASAATGRIRVTAVDHIVQEGARRLDFTGQAEASLAGAGPLDLSRQANGDVMLTLLLRIDQAATTPVRIGASCGQGCAGAVTLSAADWQALGQGQWRRLGVPLKCLARAGLDEHRVEAPLTISATGRFTVSVARVGLGTDVDHVVTCG